MTTFSEEEYRKAVALYIKGDLSRFQLDLVKNNLQPLQL